MKRILLMLLVAYPVILFSQEEWMIIMSGKALAERSNYSEAIQLLSDPLVSRDNIKAIIELGNIYRRARKYEEALSEYSKVESIARGAASLEFARTYSLTGDYRSAADWLSIHLRSEFRKSEKEIMTDPYLSGLSGQPEWKDLWKGDFYSGSEKKKVEVEYYVRLGQTEEAKFALNELKNLSGQNSDYYLALSELQISNKEYSGALSSLSHIDPTVKNEEQVLRLKAECEMGAGNYPMAYSTYSSLLKDGYFDAGILLLRSKAAVKMGDISRGIKDLEFYLELYPGDAEVNITVSQLYNAQGDYFKSLTLLSENIRNKPGDAAGYRNRADIYMKTGSYDGAFADLSMSLDLDPGNATAWLNTGLALVKSGKTEQACHYFKKANDMGMREAASLISKYCNR